MRTHNSRSTTTRRVAGAGLLALDVVVSDDAVSALTFAGGTCGNVLSILAYLHWRSAAIGFLGDDAAGRRVLADLKRAGVGSEHLIATTQQRTAVFVQNLQRTESGQPRHTFSEACPACGQSFVNADRPPKAAMPIQRFGARESPDVFFMDRLSEDILELAQSAKGHGAVIFYEPSSPSDMHLWTLAFPLVDIVKYSADRFDEQELAKFTHRKRPSSLWEVKTLGASGLKYRVHSGKTRADVRWTHSSAIPAPRVVDTCGAGDWCTAGLLHGLVDGERQVTHETFSEAIKLGQALAAWACAFVGARGAMYCSDFEETWRSVERLVRGLSVASDHLPRPAAVNVAGAGCIPGLCDEKTDVEGLF